MFGPQLPAPEQSGLPGFTLPVNYLPHQIYHDLPLCSHALHYPDASLKVHREILMMRLMNTITDKPEWDQKVFNAQITSKWCEEIAQGGEDISPRMMDYIIKELQWKAKLFETDGCINVFDIGVIKSDTAISEDLRKALADAVAPLENVPDDQKDYHPGSDQKVLDLVHPSLFPLVYGHTRILRNELIGLDDCLGATGQGEVIPVPSMEKKDGWRFPDDDFYSRKFQWLPCDVKLSSTEPEPECRISSYINNLHPTRHRDLYGIIEKVITRAIPLWNRSLNNQGIHSHRIEYTSVEYDEGNHPDPKPEQGFDEDKGDFWNRMGSWQDVMPILKPEPAEFKSKPDEKIQIYDVFGKTGLQVIVKLANIELSPESPEYEGGSWHIEGQLNERICATAIYYYDSENITESTLSFRQRIEAGVFDGFDFHYPQSDRRFLQDIYGLDPDLNSSSFHDQRVTQHLGSVVCRQGRLLTFPNVVQHRVTPFSLADKSKPGHRKILALFLVDPHLRIISTANVPPQQEDWGKEKYDLTQGMLSQKVPPELRNMICDEGILQQLMSMDEAKKFRLELMKERSVNSGRQNEAFENYSFGLCEH
ncbi:hypothetical protein N7520_009856 [Penicillium odoratum]|uniref:uncharacterized protein n=1 Tax=Penicillium odoratum TaxID=1167516 RepID=UPI0025490FA6|nr:uncharacterized protein N7520_009856 [Penicillium odoratum]KAJ5752939.1 hypothetical protein N7520_009856 [Penicillium odoratum]